MYEYVKYLPKFINSSKPSEVTMKHYVTEIENYLKWCDKNCVIAEEATQIDAINYIGYLREKGYKATSINLKTAALKMFYYAGLALNAVESNPFDKIKREKQVDDDTNFTYFTSDEIAKICKDLINSYDLRDIRNLCIILLMSIEGCRTIELERLNNDDVDFEKNRILVDGKGKKSYIYPCSQTMDFLKKYINFKEAENLADDTGPFFISLNKKYFGNRLTRQGIRQAVNEAIERAGLKKKEVSCHTLRHSCATNLYSETKDIRIVQETLRHSSPRSTARYAHLIDREEKRETSKIFPIKKAAN